MTPKFYFMVSVYNKRYQKRPIFCITLIISFSVAGTKNLFLVGIKNIFL
jgi:hypothetical protein